MEFAETTLSAGLRFLTYLFGGSIGPERGQELWALFLLICLFPAKIFKASMVSNFAKRQEHRRRYKETLKYPVNFMGGLALLMVISAITPIDLFTLLRITSEGLASLTLPVCLILAIGMDAADGYLIANFLVQRRRTGFHWMNAIKSLFPAPITIISYPRNHTLKYRHNEPAWFTGITMLIVGSPHALLQAVRPQFDLLEFSAFILGLFIAYAIISSAIDTAKKKNSVFKFQYFRQAFVGFALISFLARPPDFFDHTFFLLIFPISLSVSFAVLYVRFVLVRSRN